MIVSELSSLFSLKVDAKSFTNAESQLRVFANKAQAAIGALAGVFAIQAVSGFVRELVQAGSALEDVSKRIGITTTALQELQFAAGQNGVSAGELEGALRRLSASAFQASKGGGEAQAVYAKLGVQVKDTNGEVKNSEQLLAEVADGLQKTTNPTERAAIAMQIFGRSGTALIPFLENGSEGVNQLRKRFKELGGGFDPEFVKNADEVGDKLDELTIINQSVKSRIGNVLLPIVSWAITKFTDFGIAINKVLKGTEYLKVAFWVLAAASAAAGIAAIAPWLPAIATWVAIGAAVAGVIAILEDLYGLITGKRSLIGQWIDEWLGIGTVTEFVNNWHIGIDSLTNSLKGLWQFGNDVIEMFFRLGKTGLGKAMGFDVSENEAKRAKVQQRIADAEQSAFENVVAGGRGWWSAVTGQTDQSQVASGRGVSASLALDPSIPRTTARGIAAPLAQSSPAFGQAARGALTGEAGNSIQVTVNAQTNASPEEIARLARQEVVKGLDSQNRNLRAAKGGRSSR